MSLFENLKQKVTDTAKVAAKKSGELVEITKLNMSISSEEDKIKKVYSEIGKSVYESFTKGETGAYSKQCEEIETYKETIKQLKQKILDLKDSKVCQSCGTEVAAAVAYCPKCGNKLEEVVAAAEIEPEAEAEIKEE